MTFKTVRITSFQRGLLFRNGEFQRLLPPGTHRIVEPFADVRVDVVSLRDPWLPHPDLDLLIKAGVLNGLATVIDLQDHERALAWVDGRFDRILGPGRYAYWHGYREVRIETVDASAVRFTHPDLSVILSRLPATTLVEICAVAEGHAGVYSRDGAYVETLPPGQYAFWRQIAVVKVCTVELREQVMDVAGQELMTADKVTLRLNVVATYRVVDPVKALSIAEDVQQTLYREVQLALRAVVGTRELDVLLSEKDAVARELDALVRRRAEELGVAMTIGIRDIILPGEMRDLLNKVMEAKKAAEASLITRREETAAVRSQANTARLLENNPTLMRLRELDVLEKIAEKANLQIVLGEKGLADRVINLL